MFFVSKNLLIVAKRRQKLLSVRVIKASFLFMPAFKAKTRASKNSNFSRGLDENGANWLKLSLLKDFPRPVDLRTSLLLRVIRFNRPILGVAFDQFIMHRLMHNGMLKCGGGGGRWNDSSEATLWVINSKNILLMYASCIQYVLWFVTCSYFLIFLFKQDD